MRKFFVIMLAVSWLLLLPCAAKASVYIEPDPDPPESMEGIYTIDGVIYRITGEDTVEVGYDAPRAVDPMCAEPVEMIYECDALPDQAQIGEIFGYEDMIYQIVTLPEDEKAGEVRVMQRYLITYEKIMIKIPEWISYKGEQYQVTSVGKHLLNFGQQVLLPDSIRILDRYALTYGDFSDFDFPESLEVIGEGALGGSGFKRINLPGGLRVIGDHAFDIHTAGNTKAHIEELVIPEGVESIGEQAFAYSFSKISLPGSLTYLGERAFTARNLKEIVLSGENASLYLEEGVLFQRTSTDTILVLYPSQREGREYTVPEGVTAIAPYAFESCNLEKVILPQSMTVIGDEAFSHSGLEQIVLPDGITRIGDKAFSHSGLEQIVLPDGIIQIGESAFSLCENLREIYIPASVESIGKGALFETHDFLCLRTGHSREGWESILKKTSRRNIGYSGMAFLVGEPFWFVWEPIGLCLFGIGSCLILVVSGIHMKKRKKSMEESYHD